MIHLLGNVSITAYTYLSTKNGLVYMHISDMYNTEKGIVHFVSKNVKQAKE